MNIKRRGYLAITTLILAIVLLGCSRENSELQYYSSAQDFNKVYFEIVENIDLGNTIKTLEQLQNEGNQEKIEQLATLIEDIKENIPKNRENLYDSFKQRYENLVFLKDSFAKFDSLNKDDRGKIDRIFILIGMDIENWKDKKSTIIWE